MPGGLLNSGTKLAGCRIGGSSIEHENHNAISKFCKAITKRSECKSNLEKGKLQQNNSLKDLQGGPALQ